MKYSKQSRRMFLQGSGASLLAIPFLPSLFPESARAAQSAPELKFVQVSSPQHAPRDFYWPELLTPLAPYTQLDAAFKANSLMAIIAKQGTISPAMGKQWAALAPYMNLITGACLYGANISNNKHNCTAPSTCSTPNLATSGDGVNPAANDPSNPYSLDWYAEKYLNQTGPAKMFPALRMYLAYRHGGTDTGYLHYEHTNWCYKGPNPSGRHEALTNPEMNDVAQLEALLAGAGAATQDPSAGNRTKLVDAVLEDYKRVLNDRRISGTDKSRLSDAIDLWNQVANKRAGAVSGASCNYKIAGAPKASDNPRAPWLAYNQYTMDLLSLALSCGLTKVVTYGLAHAGDDLYRNYNEYERLHAVQHDRANSLADNSAMAVWRADRMAYFANRIAGLKDENGQSLLESTLMYWGWEFGSYAHDHCGTTSVLIGKAAGRLQTGNHISGLGQLSPAQNFYATFKSLPPLNKVHMTILKAFGLTDQQIEVRGTPGFGEYADVTITSNEDRTGGIGYSNENRAQWLTVAEKRKPIPILNP